MTLDNGKTWHVFEQHGRGWDFGAVDWSRQSPHDMLAIHHESGQELYHSGDCGKSWRLLGKDFTAIGIFDSGAYVASKGDGILRSVDSGVTWSKVSDTTPTGRVLCVEKGVGYWLTQEGLLVSRDKGATWQPQGSPLDAVWGPFFGKNAREIAVVGRRGQETGFWKTEDAGKTWKLAAPFPDFGANARPDWGSFETVGRRLVLQLRLELAKQHILCFAYGQSHLRLPGEIDSPSVLPKEVGIYIMKSAYT